MYAQLAIAFPKGLLLLLVFVKHNHWLARLGTPLTAIPVKHTVLFVTLSTMYTESGQTRGKTAQAVIMNMWMEEICF